MPLGVNFCGGDPLPTKSGAPQLMLTVLKGCKTRRLLYRAQVANLCLGVSTARWAGSVRTGFELLAATRANGGITNQQRRTAS